MQEFLKQFEALIAAEKFEEAKELLSTFGALESTPEDRVEAKLFITELYMRLTNAASRAYLAMLDDSLDKLKILDAKEREIDEKVKIAQARASLTQ